MSRMTTYPAGTPSWVAQLSPDVDAARSFYAALFGWTFHDITAEGDPSFYLASNDDDPVASLTGPVPSATWIIAVSVSDLGEARRSAERAGGTAPGDSVDIATLGRFHRLHDPAGAEIHAVQPLEDRRPTRVDEVGAWSSSTLSVADPTKVAPFYESVFGWHVEAGSGVQETTVFASAGEIVAVTRPDAAIESCWTPGFLVADVDAAVETATALGGRVLEAPTSTATGYAAVLADPGGGRFCVSQRLSR